MIDCARDGHVPKRWSNEAVTCLACGEHLGGPPYKQRFFGKGFGDLLAELSREDIKRADPEEAEKPDGIIRIATPR